MPDIALYQRCNCHCLMCTNSDEFINSPDSVYGLKTQLSRLRRFAGTGDPAIYPHNGTIQDYFLFTGGEPTLHPDILRILKKFRRAFPVLPFCLLTNGRSLAYPLRARAVWAALGRPASIAIPLHGHDAKTHDSITRAPGSFAQTLKGLLNVFRLRGRGQDIEIRIILHRRTSPRLPRMLAFLLQTLPDPSLYRVVLIYMELEGQAEKNMRRLRISLSESARAVAASRPLLARFPHVRLYHFPLCVLPEDLRAKAANSLPPEALYHPARCRACSKRKSCMGVQTWYPSYFSEKEFSPIKIRPRAHC